MNHSTPSEPQGRVLPFRPRGSRFARSSQPPPPPIADLERFERSADEPDDFRHRMIMNGLGLAVTVALVAAGLWIAEVMAEMRKNQDCVLTGRSGCTHVDAPIRAR